MPDVLVVPDREAVAETAAEIFVAAAAAAVDDRGRFVVALSGGATPRRLYGLLAEPSFAAGRRKRAEGLHVGDRLG